MCTAQLGRFINYDQNRDQCFGTDCGMPSFGEFRFIAVEIRKLTRLWSSLKIVAEPILTVLCRSDTADLMADNKVILQLH